jgi:Mg2+ and Co2+ transporter CorA
MRIFKSRSQNIKEFAPETEKELSPLSNPPGLYEQPPVKLPEIKRVPKQPVTERSPPLFIKVDKYRDVINNIKELRSHVLNLRDALDVLADVQKEIATGIEIAHKNLDHLNVILSNLDSFFLRPHRAGDINEKITRPEEQGPAEIDDYARDVYSQIEKLRSQLKSMS